MANTPLPTEKLVEFEGKTFSFPADASQDEIFGFLDTAVPAPAPTPSTPGLSFKQSEDAATFGDLDPVLQDFAKRLNIPATITSTMRTPEYNASVGGVPNSRHLTGQALDYRVRDLTPDQKSAIVEYYTSKGVEVIDEGDHLHVQMTGERNQPIAKPGLTGEGMLAGPGATEPKDVLPPEPPSASRQVEFEGKLYDFPADATEAEIFQFLETVPPAAPPQEEKGFFQGMFDDYKKQKMDTAAAVQAGGLPDFSLGRSAKGFLTQEENAARDVPQKDFVPAAEKYIQENEVGDKLAGLLRSGATAASAMTSGNNLGYLALAPFSAVPQMAMFGPQMAGNAVVKGKEAYDKNQAGDTAGEYQAAGDAILSSIFAAGSALGLKNFVKGGAPLPPTTAGALAPDGTTPLPKNVTMREALPGESGVTGSGPQPITGDMVLRDLMNTRKGTGPRTLGGLIKQPPQQPGVPPTGTPITSLAEFNTQGSGLVGQTGKTTGRGVDPERVAFRPDKINSVDDVQTMVQDFAKRNNQFTDQRLSKSNADIKRMAKALAIDEQEILKAKPGSIVNSETLAAVRDQTTFLAEDLHNALRAIDISVASPEQLAEIGQKSLRLQGYMKSVAGFRTEASHIFRELQRKTTGVDHQMLSQMAIDLKKLGMESPDMLDFAGKSRQLMDPTLADKAWHLWYASILSGSSTQARNFVGNFGSLTTEVGRVALTKPTELPTALTGLFKGLWDGLGEAKDILKNGAPDKFQSRGVKPVTFTGLAKPLNVMDYVGRTMSAVDAVFKAGAKEMEFRGAAREWAKKNGGKTYKDFFAKATPDDWKAANQAAAQFADYATFNQDPKGMLGYVAKKISGYTHGKPVGPFDAMLRGGVRMTLFPFTRIVANVLNNGLDYTPLGAIRAIEGKRGGTLNPRQYHQQMSRAVMGTVAMTYLATQAQSGVITGAGPKDPGKNAQWRAAGNRPNSVKIGNTYYPYTYWGPTAIPLAIVGNYADSINYGDLSEKDAGERLSMALLGTASTIFDMSFLSGAGQLMTAINEYDTYGPRFVEQLAARQIGSIVPAGVKQVNNYFDNTAYETETFGDAVQQQLGLSKAGLRPKVDVTGNTVKRDTIHGLSSKEVDSGTEVQNWLAKNNQYISTPARKLEIYDLFTKKKREMTPDERYTFQVEAGKRINQALSLVLPSLDRIPNPDIQKRHIDHLVENIRLRVKAEISRKALNVSSEAINQRIDSLLTPR